MAGLIYHSFIESVPATGTITLRKNEGGEWYTFAIPNEPINLASEKNTSPSNVLVCVENPVEGKLSHKRFSRKGEYWLLHFPYYLWVIGERKGAPLAKVVRRGS